MNTENGQKLSIEEIQLKEKLDAAFWGLQNAEIVKTQTGKRGRTIFLPLMAVLASAIYGVCVYFMSWINLEYRILGLVVGTAIYLFFMLRFALCFVTDLRTKKFAERIYYLREGGARYLYGEGLYTRKFETADGGFAVWGKKQNYEKFGDKNKFSPLASRYDRHLQRRSSNYSVFSAEFWFDKLDKGSFAVRENAVEAINGDGSFLLTFDGGGLLKKISVTGAADVFYDSGSPIHIYDAKVPFDYTVEYTFTRVNDPSFVLKIPEVFLSARKDYLLPQIRCDKIEWTKEPSEEATEPDGEPKNK